MTPDLAAWLLADDGPIAEDERWATDALMKGDWNGAMGLHDYREPVGQHIARWNPARVLAECAAKRAIVESYLTAATVVDVSQDTILRGAAAINRRAYGTAVQALAQVYAGRPGWRDEWAA